MLKKQMPPDSKDAAVSDQGMGYYATAVPIPVRHETSRGKEKSREEQDILERLGIHQEQRFSNGDTRAYNSLPRGANYYVHPGSTQNGVVPSHHFGAYPMRGTKFQQMLQSLTCCFRAPQLAGRRQKEFFVIPTGPSGRYKKAHNSAKPSRASNPQSDQSGFLEKLLQNKRRFRGSQRNGGMLRPSKLSLGYPSPILGIQNGRDKTLLPTARPLDAHKSCLIVDLDETLVHSSFKPVQNPDFIIPVEIDGAMHQVYVIKRPFVDEFLEKIGEWFECVLFTASLAKYADPVADLLDKWGVFRYRLFREACVTRKGSYIKDLNRLGRDLRRVIILDNSPASYAYHPDNAIPVQSWFGDNRDTELIDLLPFLEKLAQVDNVYHILRRSKEEATTRRVIRSRRR